MATRSLAETEDTQGFTMAIALVQEAAHADALAEALSECVEDLVAEIDTRNPPAWGDVYPTMCRKRERDLAPVMKARAALAAHAARDIERLREALSGAKVGAHKTANTSNKP